MIKKALAYSILLTSLATPAWAASGGAGTAGSAFLTLDAGARAIGMGGAYSAVADEASAIYWNPAGLARIKRASASIMHASYLADISYDFASYAHRIQEKTTVAGAVYVVNYGNLTQTDIAGNTVGTFSPRDAAYVLSAAEKVEEFIDPDKTLYMGFTAKYLSSKIIDSASGIAGDVGMLLHHNTALPYYISVVLQNFGNGQTFDKEKDQLPSRLKIGASTQLWNRLILAIEGTRMRSERNSGALGAEFNLTPGEQGGVFLRGGFNSLTEKDLEGYAGVNVGLGLQFKSLSFDYALSPFGELGTAHRMSVNFNW